MTVTPVTSVRTVQQVTQHQSLWILHLDVKGLFLRQLQPKDSCKNDAISLQTAVTRNLNHF